MSTTAATKDSVAADQLLEQHDQSHPVWANAGLEDVRQGMSETGYPEERVHFVQGMVEDTIPNHAPDRIAVLRLDTDWYASTRHELEHLYPRLVPGGVLLLDDYGYWEGSRRATEEYPRLDRRQAAPAAHGRGPDRDQAALTLRSREAPAPVRPTPRRAAAG